MTNDSNDDVLAAWLAGGAKDPVVITRVDHPALMTTWEFAALVYGSESRLEVLKAWHRDPVETYALHCLDRGLPLLGPKWERIEKAQAELRAALVEEP